MNKRKVKILDCTLRDGGRIIDCAFSNREISEISAGLADAKLDFVEIGFLRDSRMVTYSGDSTFFTDVKQIEPFIKNRESNTQYLAFVDYGMFDFSTLEKCSHKGIQGIRVGFTKKDYLNDFDNVRKSLSLVKEMGYKLFIQGVNSIGYSDAELLEIVEMVNDIRPYSFGIVDTYGAMYSKDLQRIFTLVDNNLEPGICLDFHSHNNFQMSFALAQEIISINEDKRTLILDSTLDGMGKCAGNLNTELIVDYMNRICDYDYDCDMIFDLIDEFIVPYKKQHAWGYSIPAMMAGIYKSHPNNVIYLTDKFELQTKDIKYLLNQIEPDKRQRYDYDNIERLYIEYNASKLDDGQGIEEIMRICQNREVLILAPGKSLDTERDKIEQIINKRNPIIFSVNFIYNITSPDYYVFLSNRKRFSQFKEKLNSANVIATSNIQKEDFKCIWIDYSKAIECGWKYFDNATLMLLRTLFKRVNVEKIMIAGFDGYVQGENNYFNKELENVRREKNFKELNREIQLMLDKLLSSSDTYQLEFVTPSIFKGRDD